ncbi:MAG: hypothetical protein A2284_01420 [Deltaproteobacteria bacterium RIFOXYA12_FULL_61_11]|nr:MAG: hypothetical protein A2284_01420 [Deltaproteobacteria bacterium RIFOXYA12_FULL_61_11]
MITTPFTFVATAEVVALLGATPVFADIDPATLLLDPDALAELLEHRVTARGRVRLPKELRLRAVLPVDLFGLPCDYDRILPLARRHGLFVLGDAAQSFGARYHGKPVGSLCEVTATSFFPAKPLGCYGDGGAVLTDDGELLDILQSLRVHGRGSHKYENVRVGLNGRLDTLQAAVLLAKLPIFEEEVEARSQVASRYRELLAERVQLQCEPEGLRSVWAQYSILTDNRDACMAQLHAAGVPTNIYYPHPLHLQRAFTTLGYREGDFPHAEAAAKRIFSLPMHPYLDPSTQRRIVDILVANL